MESDWFQFQEEICLYFNSVGVNSQTNVSISGVRTSHDIDILIKTKFLGHDVTWIIETKKWDRKVSKLHVLALRSIVEDVGADKGFIISEKGFQRGAFEAAKNSNVGLLTFMELKVQAKEYIEGEIIKAYKDRLKILEIRYWSHSKKIRRKYGLRGEIWDFPLDFSGHNLILTARNIIEMAENRNYPIDLETHLVEKRGELIARNFQQVQNWLNLNLNFLDEKILSAEINMIKNGDFNPQPTPLDDELLPLEMLADAMAKARKKQGGDN